MDQNKLNTVRRLLAVIRWHEAKQQEALRGQTFRVGPKHRFEWQVQVTWEKIRHVFNAPNVESARRHKAVQRRLFEQAMKVLNE